MTIKKVIAKRYAIALFAAAKAQNAEDAVLAELKALRSALLSDRKKAKCLTSSILPIKQQQVMWKELLSSNMHALTKNYIELLLSNNRLEILISSIESLDTIINKDNGITALKLTTAVMLDSGRVNEIVNTIKAIVGGKVSVQTKVEPAIQGGLVLQIGAKMLDLSVKGKLDKVKRIIKAVTV